MNRGCCCSATQAIRSICSIRTSNPPCWASAAGLGGYLQQRGFAQAAHYGAAFGIAQAGAAAGRGHRPAHGSAHAHCVDACPGAAQLAQHGLQVFAKVLAIAEHYGGRGAGHGPARHWRTSGGQPRQQRVERRA